MLSFFSCSQEILDKSEQVHDEYQTSCETKILMREKQKSHTHTCYYLLSKKLYPICCINEDLISCDFLSPCLEHPHYTRIPARTLLGRPLSG